MWTTVLLGAAAGCAGENEPAPGPSAPPSEIKSDPAARLKLNPAPPAAPEPKKGDEAPKVEGPKAENSKPAAAAAKLTADELAAIKELPAAEQELATQQLVCPVSSHHLGSMGKPLKVTAENRTFYLCCDSCEEELKANPKAAVAKLDKKGN